MGSFTSKGNKSAEICEAGSGKNLVKTPVISLQNASGEFEDFVEDEAVEVGEVGGGGAMTNEQLKKVIQEGRREIKETQEKFNSSLTTPIVDSEAKVSTYILTASVCSRVHQRNFVIVLWGGDFLDKCSKMHKNVREHKFFKSKENFFLMFYNENWIEILLTKMLFLCGFLQICAQVGLVKSAVVLYGLAWSCNVARLYVVLYSKLSFWIHLHSLGYF